MCIIFNRVETSSQTPAPIFGQQPKSITQNRERNYYNTTSNQGFQNPSSQFDSYYSVYDDDVELYRDIGKFRWS